MIELPETYVLAEQINQTLTGKTVLNPTVNASPLKLAGYNGSPAWYHYHLAGKVVRSANPGTSYTCGGYIEVLLDDTLLILSTPTKYHAPGEKLPVKHHLRLEFEDLSSMTCTVQMWGVMLCYPLNEINLPDWFNKRKSPTPLEDGFDQAYFEGLLSGAKKSLSAKAFLATEQRIPGLGNGVLQDILWNAGIHPKRKLQTLTDYDLEKMYHSVKSTLYDMWTKGGRNTERDLFNHNGGYKTILSAITFQNPCPVCGGRLIREAYLGGNIYYCPICQPEKV